MNSVFYEEIVEYLSLREKFFAPTTITMDRCALFSFDQHLVNRGKAERSDCEDDVASWLQPMYHKLARNTIAGKIRSLRMFLEYLRNKEVPVYIPPRLKVSETYVPYLFSDAEIKNIFAAADSISFRKNSKHPIIFPMVLRMLYSCGFRLGELLAIQVCDISFKQGVVLLRDTKNRKQRMVPLGDTLTDMLYRYCLAMDLLGDSENYIFPGREFGKHISQRVIEEWFEALLKENGIYNRTKKYARGPCLHCFRHLFTVKAFAQAENAGRPIKESVPFLSVYLGHSSMNETEKYLKFSSDIFPEHTALFETYAQGIFPEVCYEG